MDQNLNGLLRSLRDALAAFVPFLRRHVENQPTPPPMPTPQPTLKKLIDALIVVESDGNDFAIGDKTLIHKAYGPLQIRQPYMDDVNRAQGTTYKAQDCLGNRKLSVWAFDVYMDRWARPERLGRPVTDQDRARIHNGGPNGWKNPATLPYWKKVERLLISQ